MKAIRKVRRGFTLVEALVSTGLATLILGTGMLMWLNGSKGFTRATQHSSIREQALMILERLGRDLDGLIVSQERNPKTDKFFLVQPYQLTDWVDAPPDKDGKPHRFAQTFRFHVYHRTEMIRVTNPLDPAKRKEEVESETDNRDEPADGSVRLPRIVGRYIEYKVVPSAEKGGGVDLLRNGQKINLIALTEVRFERGDPVHARQSLGASPNAVLDITVVPRAGIDGTLDESIVRKQDDTGTALSRVIHLVGYESQYTALLGLALEKWKAKQQLDDLELAVMQDAKVWGFLEEEDEKLTKVPIRYRLPEDLIHIEVDKAFDTKSRPDPEFSRADVRQGASIASVLKRAGAGSGSAHGAWAGSASALEGAP